MEKESIVSHYMQKVTERLKVEGFHIKYNISYSNWTFKCVAIRRRFQIEHLGLAETFFIFVDFSYLDAGLFRDFSKKCLAFARESKISPFPYTPLFDIAICFPVGLVTSLDIKTAKEIQNSKPPWLFCDYEMAVICDIGAKRLYYPERTPNYAIMRWETWRNKIREILSP